MGVVLGIAVLIVVISVFTGFEREIEAKIIGFDATMLVNANGEGPNGGFFPHWRQQLKPIRKASSVGTAASKMLGPGSAHTPRKSQNIFAGTSGRGSIKKCPTH